MKNRDGKYVTIRNAALADEFTKEFARNIIENQLPKKIRNNMYLEKIDNGKKKDLPESDIHIDMDLNNNEDIRKWISRLDIFSDLENDAEKRKNKLCLELSNVDKALNDIIHYCEFYNFNASQGYKISKKIKELRIKRRDIKNELDVIQFILNKNRTNNIKKESQEFINQLNTQQYEPRILTELFDI